VQARVGGFLEAEGRAEQLANGLGWFSIALGAAELAVPGGVARLIGVRDDEDNRAVLRTCGLREIASGAAILSQPDPTSALWGRVGGDLMDLFLLGTAASKPGTGKGRLGFAAAAVAGVTLLDVLAGLQHSSQSQSGAPQRMVAGRSSSRVRRLSPEARASELAERGLNVKHVITVNRPVDEVYRFWKDFQNLPTFMHHLESVQMLDARHSRWRAKAPAGATVEWEAETVEDRANELIAWRSLPGASVHNAGVVRFKRAPGNRGTEVDVELSYRPPLGAVGAAIAKLFGEAPEQQVKHDLKMFKAVMETGEVVHSDASVRRGMHPAQPSAPTRLATSTQRGQLKQIRGAES
jgi:uncharacterized membrane protein